MVAAARLDDTVIFGRLSGGRLAADWQRLKGLVFEPRAEMKNPSRCGGHVCFTQLRPVVV